MELEAVVGQADVWWEGGVGGFVVETVGHVGEEGASRLDLLHQRDGVLQVRVGGVGFVAKRVKDEDVESGEQGEALGGEVAEVGEVGGGAEAVAGDGLAAMGDGDALKLAPNRRCRRRGWWECGGA